MRRGDPPETQPNPKKMLTCAIHNSLNGSLLATLSLPEDQVENLSADTEEGHFRAGSMDELTEAGIDPEQLVYAIVR